MSPSPNKNSTHIVAPKRSNSRTTPVNYHLFFGIVISLFLGCAHWKQRTELLTLKTSSSVSSSSLSSPSVVPSSNSNSNSNSYHQHQHQHHHNQYKHSHNHNQHPPEPPTTQCTCPINPATFMADDTYNDAKLLLDEMKEQESKWKIKISDKTSQIETLKRDKAYVQRTFHDLQTKYNTDMQRSKDQMNDLQRKFDDLLKAYATELSRSRDRMDECVAQSGIHTITNMEGLKQAIVENHQHYNMKYKLEQEEKKRERVGAS